MSEGKRELLWCNWCKRISYKNSENGYCQKCFEAKLITFIEKSAYTTAIEAFRKYGRHVEYCYSRDGLDCDCGFSNTLKELGE